MYLTHNDCAESYSCQVAVTYWRAGGEECENDSALPINRAKDSHAHTDGGLILWRADNDNDYSGVPFLRSGGCGGGKDGENGLNKQVDSKSMRDGSSSNSQSSSSTNNNDSINSSSSSSSCRPHLFPMLTARRRVKEETSEDYAGGFVEFVSDTMSSVCHDNIRGCDEMLLDAFLKVAVAVSRLDYYCFVTLGCIP